MVAALERTAVGLRERQRSAEVTVSELPVQAYIPPKRLVDFPEFRPTPHAKPEEIFAARGQVAKKAIELGNKRYQQAKNSLKLQENPRREDGQWEVLTLGEVLEQVQISSKRQQLQEAVARDDGGLLLRIAAGKPLGDTESSEAEQILTSALDILRAQRSGAPNTNNEQIPQFEDVYFQLADIVTGPKPNPQVDAADGLMTMIRGIVQEKRITDITSMLTEHGQTPESADYFKKANELLTLMEMGVSVDDAKQFLTQPTSPRVTQILQDRATSLEQEGAVFVVAPGVDSHMVSEIVGSGKLDDYLVNAEFANGVTIFIGKSEQGMEMRLYHERMMEPQVLEIHANLDASTVPVLSGDYKHILESSVDAVYAHASTLAPVEETVVEPPVIVPVLSSAAGGTPAEAPHPTRIVPVRTGDAPGATMPVETQRTPQLTVAQLIQRLHPLATEESSQRDIINTAYRLGFRLPIPNPNEQEKYRLLGIGNVTQRGVAEQALAFLEAHRHELAALEPPQTAPARLKSTQPLGESLLVEPTYPIPEYIHVTKLDTPEHAGQALAAKISTKIQEARAANEKVLLLLAGGSAFGAYNGISANVLGEDVAIAMADDRFTTNPAESNMVQLVKTEFYQNAVNAGCQIVDTQPRAFETLSTYADRYNGEVMQYVREGRRIILVLGVGGTGNAEGHVAGIAPDLTMEENPDAYLALFGPHTTGRAVVGYNAQGKITPVNTRATITPNFIANMMKPEDSVIVFTTGSAKANAVREAFNPKGSVQEIPARVIQLTPGTVDMVLDEAAAAKIRPFRLHRRQS